LPMACVMLLGAALWQLLVPEIRGVPWFDYDPFSLSSWHGATASLITQILLTLIGVSGFTVIVLWVVFSFATGRNLKQRLTDPALISDAVETA
jgi:hypothetical protein